MKKIEMIKKFNPVLNITQEGIDFKWFDETDLNNLPVDENNYVLVDGIKHHIWTLHHSDDGSCDFLSASFRRVNSLGQYVLTQVEGDCYFDSVDKGVYRILKSIK